MENNSFAAFFSAKEDAQKNKANVDKHISELARELSRVKPVQEEKEKAICEVYIGSGHRVEVDMESGVVSGKTPLDADETLKRGRPYGLSFSLIRHMADSELEAGVWDGSFLHPSETFIPAPDCVLLTGGAVYRIPGTTSMTSYFRIAAGSKFSRGMDFWLKYGSGKKPQAVRDAIDLGKFHLLEGLSGARFLMEVKVNESKGKDGKSYPELEFTPAQTRELASMKLVDFPRKPWIYFRKNMIWRHANGTERQA